MNRYTADDIRDFVAKHQRGGDWNYNDLIPILRQAADDAENLSAAQFIAYLIDNHEGETVSEYMLQIWLADAMTATRTPKEQTK